LPEECSVGKFDSTNPLERKLAVPIRMPDHPRVAVGTIQPGAESRTIVWALMEALRQAGVQVQHFGSRASCPACEGAARFTGFPPRHLDSWLMSPGRCREILLRGKAGSDLAVVEGEFEGAARPEAEGGRLETLCRWLNLPRIVVLDADRIARCGLPERPQHVDGVLVDRVGDSGHLARLATDLEVLWAVPVVGALESVPRWRARLEAVPRGERPPRRLCEQFAGLFLRSGDPLRVWHLAAGRPLPRCAPPTSPTEPAMAKLTVAVAYDEAFCGYFQDTLDQLELWGASLVDFSPLRDEGLPPDVDLVYLGCGHPERYAAALAENHCMKAALRSHLASGRRIYGEGGGAAYLCQHLETPDGYLRRMVGILPAVARRKRLAVPPLPVEVTFRRPNWLGKPPTRVRGYLNGCWQIEPTCPHTGFVQEPAHRSDLLGNFGAIGSMLHLDFAARPALLSRFFYPLAPPSRVADPWAVVS
jgi:cobyrinic acid a,c-diamide synthase